MAQTTMTALTTPPPRPMPPQPMPPRHYGLEITTYQDLPPPTTLDHLTTPFHYHYGLKITTYQDLPPPTALDHLTTPFHYARPMPPRPIAAGPTPLT